MVEKEINDLNETLVYELGYHILPTVPEENISGEVSQIHAILREYNGSVIAEGMPMLRQLAYEIAKKIETKSLKFSKAYFGWVKFETDPSQITNLKNKIESLPNILRIIIVKTVKENTMHTPKIPMFKKESHKEETPLETVEKTPVSEAEIDKSIDELVIN